MGSPGAAMLLRAVGAAETLTHQGIAVPRGWRAVQAAWCAHCDCRVIGRIMVCTGAYQSCRRGFTARSG
jgi:hypothetical protein